MSHRSKEISYHLSFKLLVFMVVTSFSKILIDLKKIDVKTDVMPKTSKDNISVPYGCIRFDDSYRFLSNSSDEFVKTLDNDNFSISKRGFRSKGNCLTEKVASPYE